MLEDEVDGPRHRYLERYLALGIFQGIELAHEILRLAVAHTVQIERLGHDETGIRVVVRHPRRSEGIEIGAGALDGKHIVHKLHIVDMLTLAIALVERTHVDRTCQHQLRIEEGIALHEVVEEPFARDELVHAAKDQVGTLTHNHHLHPVVVSHHSRFVYLRFDGMDGSALGGHHSGSELFVVVERYFHEVVLKAELLAVGGGTLFVGIEDVCSLRREGVGMAAGLQVGCQTGRVHTAGEQYADAVVTAVQFVELSLHLAVDVLCCLHRYALLVGQRLV